VQDDTPTVLPWQVHEPADDEAANVATGHAHPAPGADASPPTPTCPFLRSIDDANHLEAAIKSPDAANRCVALRDAIPQSLRQQELVCLTSGHVNCPRFMRGSPVVAEPVEPEVGTRLATPAIAGSLLFLVASFLVSLAFVMNNGGLVLTAPGSSSAPSGVVLGEVEVASPTPEHTPASTSGDRPSASPAPSAGAAATASTKPPAAPTPSPTATPEPVASPIATASPGPTAKPTRTPDSDRYALLKPCPDKPNCYVYVIRSGDNLYSIARYFGVPLATVKSLNPWTANGLKTGRALQIPTPTR
jgi:LysM repeat protein